MASTFTTHLATLVRSTYRDDVTDGYADLVRRVAMDLKDAHKRDLARAEEAEARLAAVLKVVERWSGYWPRSESPAMFTLFREVRAAATDGEGE